jgi:hypothetical protein
MKIGLYTLPSRTQIATGYKRVVFGKRGPYIEFSPEQAILDSLKIPLKEHWRMRSRTAYYIEYRTQPDDRMIYHQKLCVTYADYKIGMMYVHPDDVIIKTSTNLISGKDLCEIQKWNS